MPRVLLRSLTGVLLALALSACAAWPERLPVTASDQAEARIDGFGEIRRWDDDSFQSWIAWREQLFAERAEMGRSGRIEMLAISSGSDRGAFSAGFLNGWSEAGTRPQFDIVSGVSTGALIAPYAFLGEPYDPQLASVYTTIDAGDVYRLTPLKPLLGGASLANTKPLAQLIERSADDALIDEVAREHRKGRRLLVQTTNLDAERGVVWDMGAIAASDSPQRYRLFRQVLLASASIPGFFPPVLIEVASSDAEFSELHVDGGTTSSVLAIPPAVLFESKSDEPYVEGRITILYNGALQPVFRVSEPTVFAILDRALTVSLKTADQRTIRALRRYADETGLLLEVHSAGSQADDPDVDLFDQEFMNLLYERGRERALSIRR